VGGVTAAFVPLGLPMTQFGQGVGTKVIAGTYNAGLAGTAAYGASSIFSPTQNPGLAGGLGTGSAAAGPLLQYAIPGSTGVFVNSMIQIVPGPLQTAIENRAKEKK